MVTEQNSRMIRLDIVRGRDVEKGRRKGRVHPTSYKRKNWDTVYS